MYSKAHFLISAAVGLALALATGAAPVEAAFLVAYAAVLGTAIDLDHFLIARVRTGDWRHLRRVLVNPGLAVVGQDRIFETGSVGDRTRVLSHVLLGGLLVGALATVWPFLALVSALVLYVHLVCDLVVDVRRMEWRLAR